MRSEKWAVRSEQSTVAIKKARGVSLRAFLFIKRKSYFSLRILCGDLGFEGRAWRSKLRTRILQVLICLALLVGGCARQDRTVVSLSSWGDLKEAAILGDLCRMFEKANPGVRVALQRVPYGEYNSKLMTQFAAGLAPDVLFVGIGQVTEFFPRGVMEPLDPYLARDPVDLKAYYPKSIEAFLLKGKLYALPRDIAPVACVYYNKDLFAKAGVPNPKDDWDWDQLLSAAQKLTARDEKGGVTCWGYTDDWVDPGPWFLSMGADWTDNWRHPTRYTFTDPAFVKGLQMRADLVHKYKVTPSASAVMALGGGTANLFINGRAAMFFSGIWKAPLFRGIKEFDWDVAMFPKGPTGKRGFIMGIAGYGISSSSKHKDLAWKLVKFLGGGEAAAVFARSGLAQPTLMKVADSPLFLDDQKPLNKRMLIRAVEYGRWEPAALNWREVVNGYVSPTFDRIWSGDWTARKAVDEWPGS